MIINNMNLRNKLGLCKMYEADTGADGTSNIEEVATDDKEANHEVVDKKETKTEEKAEKTEAKTFTQEEVNEIIKDRLARERVKTEKEQEEAKKLAKMNAEEKAKYEYDKLLEEVNSLKAEKSKRELQDTARNMLKEKNIDTDLLEFLDYTDAESCKASIDKLSKAWDKAIEKAIDNRIKTKTVPKMANNNNTITKEQFNKMSYKQKVELYNKNKDLYDKLSK